MSNLPSGTVTFLFTDIEASTKLAQEHPGIPDVAKTSYNQLNLMQ